MAARQSSLTLTRGAPAKKTPKAKAPEVEPRTARRAFPSGKPGDDKKPRAVSKKEANRRKRETAEATDAPKRGPGRPRNPEPKESAPKRGPGRPRNPKPEEAKPSRTVKPQNEKAGRTPREPKPTSPALRTDCDENPWFQGSLREDFFGFPADSKVFFQKEPRPLFGGKLTVWRLLGKKNDEMSRLLLAEIEQGVGIQLRELIKPMPKGEKRPNTRGKEEAHAKLDNLYAETHKRLLTS